MTARVRWEGVDEVGHSKNGVADGATAIRNTRKRSSIEFICTAVRNLSHHTTSRPSSPKPIEVKSHTKEICPTCDGNTNESKAEKVPATTESQESGTLVGSVRSTAAEEAKSEQESLLKPVKEKPILGGAIIKQNFRSENQITLANTQPLPTINDRMSLPPFSGQNTPTHQRNHPEKVIKLWKQHGNRHNIRQATVDMLSALYGIMLVVMGVAFPTSQVISIKIPSHYYEGFYAYLYFVAIGFFGYIYVLLKTQFNSLTWKRRWYQMTQRLKDKKIAKTTADGDGASQDNGLSLEDIMTSRLRITLGKELDPRHSPNHGSFYLRMGAVVFGVGSMIYSGLEFAQYFEMSSNPLCDDIMMAVQPASRMLFTFFQMYFVFLNAKIQIVKNSNVIVARFGMMHIVATNLCVWLNVIIQETKHEILNFEQHGGGDTTEHDRHQVSGHGEELVQIADAVDPDASAVIGHWLNKTVLDHVQDEGEYHSPSYHRLGKRTLSDECHRSDLMGTLTQNASPFLFPCAIEYSLICAAIMYEIWKHTGKNRHQKLARSVNDSPAGVRTPRTPRGSFYPYSQRRSPHHYSVDCTNANKGLFFGIFVLVLSILAMILFFVLIHREEYKSTAITIVHLAELILYMLTLIAVLIGIIQVSQLQFDASHPLDLDNILLIVALTGVISYNVFTIIGTQFSDHPDRMLVLINALTAVVQAVAQTVFVLGSSKRHLYTRRQEQRKPGREVVTFLMVTNFAMWAIITLEKSRFDAHPVQSQFFGQWPWTIITNISSPLAIFYRYHSTVCLCEIWKRCYKITERSSNHTPLQQLASV
ncbi:proton channel OtopLc-like isoform X2 [Daphnia pulex]|uniref:proton channel OtopLc-like isoform X2 n=1 Tax=Daphnia pulex TaxID=6669 RepID=UPI001EDFCF03|nr:proton channel OtopLc-like isoform X2 [Daphnia pulex]